MIVSIILYMLLGFVLQSVNVMFYSHWQFWAVLVLFMACDLWSHVQCLHKMRSNSNG